MTSQTTSPAAIDMDALGAHYTLQDAGEICRFLTENPALLPLVLEAPVEIRRIFGHSVPLVLEVSDDPDGGPESSKLFALIRTPESVDDGHAKLRRLDREWWLAASHAARGKMNIDVEFV